MKRTSTLKYIANELGISVSTVSRAINGKSGVNKKTKEKVLKAAEKYSYTPNEVARSLQKSSTETIAVVLPDISETFFGTIVKGIEKIVSKSGYMIILADTHEKSEKEEQYLDMLYKRRIDALVLATVGCDKKHIKPYLANDIPIVFIDNMPDISDVDAITIDNCMASSLAVSYLSSNGHKDIAVIIGSTEESTGTERLAGYKQAMENCKLSISDKLIKFGDYKFQSGYNAMMNLIQNKDSAPFSAVYVTSEKMTYGALHAIQDSGLKVPEDISLIGFDVHNLSDGRDKVITSVCQPEESIGEKVGELLLERLNSANGGDSPKTRQLLSPFLSEGNTVKQLLS